MLVLLYPRGDEWHLPLIVRPDDMPAHAGQVSLPGGMIEPGETSQQAALREFTEELGVPADGVELLGQLTEIYLFASNFQVIPWVGTLPTAPRWNPSPREVHRLLEVPLSHLLDPANRAEAPAARRHQVLCSELSLRDRAHLGRDEHDFGGARRGDET